MDPLPDIRGDGTAKHLSGIVVEGGVGAGLCLVGGRIVVARLIHALARVVRLLPIPQRERERRAQVVLMIRQPDAGGPVQHQRVADNAGCALRNAGPGRPEKQGRIVVRAGGHLIDEEALRVIETPIGQGIVDISPGGERAEHA